MYAKVSETYRTASYGYACMEVHESLELCHVPIAALQSYHTGGIYSTLTLFTKSVIPYLHPWSFLARAVLYRKILH